MSFLEWVIGILVTLTVGFLSYRSGARTERARAKHARDERDEQERRKWRQEGADAIADATGTLDLIRSEAVRRLPRHAQLSAVVAAQQQWRAPYRALVSLGAVHPDAAVTAAAVQLRSSAAEAFNAVVAATSLVPAAPFGAAQLGQMLDALTKSPPEAPHYASADEVNDAWARADSARAGAFRAMEELTEALHAAVAGR